MAGKSGRSQNDVPENTVNAMIFSWEGIMVLLLCPGQHFLCMVFRILQLKECAQADAGLSGRDIPHAANGLHTGSWRD